MIGRRLAHYEITAHLGSGGMGDVYQATDSKLDRTVALKFLPQAFAGDPDRSARFAREAKALAALNHPNIAAIHGLDDGEGERFLVMEFVPGSTLADLIGRRPLPLDEALGIARQIAEALEAAHDKGVVHRDLKPANVKITPEGQVKVLDFGLAKLAGGDAEETGRALSNSPTLSAPMTRAGVVLGTAAYMSPEQAKGRSVDRRADLFAFGCVLYEMLAGRPAFEGESAADILSYVLQRDPDWTRLPSTVPPAVRQLLRLCLEKDPRKRRQSAGDVRIDLEHALSEPSAVVPAPAVRRSRVARLAWIGGSLIAIAALAIPAAIHWRERPPREMQLQIVTPATQQPLSFALSPDGRYIVFVAWGSTAGDPDRLYLRPLDTTEGTLLPHTEGARLPFWSPDSRSVGFFASERLHRIDIAGGPAQPLASASNPRGGSWGTDGTILFAPNTVSPLFRVPASGGTAVAATTLDAPRQTSHSQPWFLPDGRHVLFHGASSDPDVSGLYLGSFDGQPPKRLIAATQGAFLAPDALVFVQQEELVARRFDPARGVLSGDAVTLATSVGAFSVSSTGIIAHRAAGGAQLPTTWFDRTGAAQNSLGVWFNGPELSPDGRRLTGDRTIDANRDVWVVDLARGGFTRLTTHPAIDGYPVWSPVDEQIAFLSNRNGTIDMWIKPSNLPDEATLLLPGPDSEWPLHWSKDGRYLLYQRSDLKDRWDLWALPMTGTDRTPFAVASTSFLERLGEFSPDGRWIAYETNESGRPEIVVQAFPEARERIPVSTAGGTAPRWSADGREIYFVAPDGMIMAVPVESKGSTMQLGAPVALFPTRITFQTFKFQYAVSSDGRFLVNNAAEIPAQPITVILNAKPF
jgi:serine/threonine protein kinase/Tol biopolymer transport system component